MPDDPVFVYPDRPWWLWPNLLGLDAVMVAVTWQLFLTREAEVPLPATTLLTLATTVWAIYLFDRWSDVQSKPIEATDRHQFAWHHRRAFLIGIVLNLLFAGFLTVNFLPASHLRIGLVLASGCAVYLLAVACGRFPAGWPGARELVVGTLFALGSAIPLLAEGPRLPADWCLGILVFAGLCTGNGILIHRWEHPDSAQPSWPFRVGLIAVVIGATLATPAAFQIAVALSITGMIVLDMFQRIMTTRLRRVLVDLALLSPWLVVLQGELINGFLGDG